MRFHRSPFITLIPAIIIWPNNGEVSLQWLDWVIVIRVKS